MKLKLAESHDFNKQITVSKQTMLTQKQACCMLVFEQC